jgi:hypothetical protein
MLTGLSLVMLALRALARITDAALGVAATLQLVSGLWLLELDAEYFEQLLLLVRSALATSSSPRLCPRLRFMWSMAPGVSLTPLLPCRDRRACCT